MFRTPFTGHTRSGYVHTDRLRLRSFIAVVRAIGQDRVLLAMIVLAGLVGVSIGGSLQVSIPSFADGFGTGDGDFGYGVLLFANGAGGVLGGFLLEVVPRFRPSTRVVVVATTLFGATTIAVAMTGSFIVAVVVLFIGGVANMASTSVGQAVVQLRAPVDQRGRMVGVYSMFSGGLKAGNGVVLAALGAAFGVAGAVAVGGIALVAGVFLVVAFLARPPAMDRQPSV